jgi:hypothetical protein
MTDELRQNESPGRSRNWATACPSISILFSHKYELHFGLRQCGSAEPHYSYHPEGESGVWQGEEAQEIYRLLENGRKFRTLQSAVYVLQSGRARANHTRWLVLPAHYLRGWLYGAWFALLNLTRSIRHRLA